MDKKESDKNTEFVKEGHDQKKSFVFQKNMITKIGVIIIAVFLIIIIIGLVVSGTSFFNSSF